MNKYRVQMIRNTKRTQHIMGHKDEWEIIIHKAAVLYHSLVFQYKLHRWDTVCDGMGLQ